MAGMTRRSPVVIPARPDPSKIPVRTNDSAFKFPFLPFAYAPLEILTDPFSIVRMNVAKKDIKAPFRQERFIPKNLIVQQRTSRLQRSEVEFPITEFRGLQRKPSSRITLAHRTLGLLAVRDVARPFLGAHKRAP